MARLLLSLSVVLAGTGGGLAADWPQFLGPHRDGHSPETQLNWNWPPTGPKVLWTFNAGSGWAGPVVAGQRLIFFHRLGDEEIVVCLDPATGQEQWKHRSATNYQDDFGFDNGPRATPTIAGNTVYTLGAAGELTALELTTGKKIWARNLLKDYQASKGFFGVACSPLVVDGKVLVNVGAKGAGIVAFDAASGQEVWKSTDDGASYSSPTTAQLDGQQVAVFYTRRGLRVVNPANGRSLYDIEWKPRDTNSVQAATPLVWNDEIFLSASYGTGALLVRCRKGELTEVWSNNQSLSSQYTTAVRVGEYLYGTDGRSDFGTGQMRCVAWKTGQVKWRETKYGVASVIAVDGGIVALTENGDLVRFDASPDGYKERARATILGKPTRAMPALAEGRLFARDAKKLIAVSLK
ncbi:MAG: PQQ-binding-like beta-propeller repeat protein [Gemmataceae bacterium]|nr:PQQ-like beta-propeller repeat protein [Gemmata sp.]MDW8196218.1 PQQ-binding-like beta-propeller repeat protein [Gemmataceae bacterium]